MGRQSQAAGDIQWEPVRQTREEHAWASPGRGSSCRTSAPPQRHSLPGQGLSLGGALALGCVTLTHELRHADLLPVELAFAVQNIVVLHPRRLYVHQPLAVVCGRTAHVLEEPRDTPERARAHPGPAWQTAQPPHAP